LLACERVLLRPSARLVAWGGRVGTPVVEDAAGCGCRAARGGGRDDGAEVSHPHPVPLAPFLGSGSPLTPQRLRGKRYVRLSHDVYLLRGLDADLRTRVEAVRLVLPDAVPCGPTAALLLGLPVDDDGSLHLARHHAAPRSRRDGVRVHRTPVDPDERHDLSGLPVADGPRTFVDLAADLPLEALVAVGDVVARRWSLAELTAAVARRPRPARSAAVTAGRRPRRRWSALARRDASPVAAARRRLHRPAARRRGPRPLGRLARRARPGRRGRTGRGAARR
jgi:hypothetical protein